jgi:1,4-alpha-glucan branching enzyme
MPNIFKVKNGKSGQANGRNQTFCFTAPEASSVQLVGDFTRWQQRPINLHRGLDGTWYVTVELQPGPHHYRFLVDGRWCDDPACALHAPNPYGGQDAVRQVA